MKRFEEELRVIRQQMEEDFVLHSERIFAQKQSIDRVERALEQVETNLGKTNERVDELSDQFQDLSDQVSTFSDQVSAFSQQVSGFSGKMNGLSGRVEGISDALKATTASVGSLRREFGDFAHTTRAYHDTWASERKRNLHLLDVVQAGMLTGGLETEARFERMEQRLRRLEEDKEGAA